MAVRTTGCCNRAASWVATPSWSPIVLKARGKVKDKKVVPQLGSLTTCKFTTRGLKNT